MNVSRLKLEAETNYEPRSHYLENSDPLKKQKKKIKQKKGKEGKKKEKYSTKQPKRENNKKAKESC